MFGFLRKLIPSWNDRQLKKMMPVVDAINDLEPRFRVMSDARLKEMTPEFRRRLATGETLDELLPEAFAVCREAAKRVIRQRHFDVQLFGGMALHRGWIAEMKTGEGKTLTATLPLYLNALTGQGCHLITVNDYLATRDSQWMGSILRFLGLSVGLIVHQLEHDFAGRQAAYGCDVTYGTNNEFGFDYLRDNMAISPEELVMQKLNYAIVDEVDSILIDEARTPLIISGPAEEAGDLYLRFAAVARRLNGKRKISTVKVQGEIDPDEETFDYIVDEKANIVNITEKGIAKTEEIIAVPNLYDPKNMHLVHYLTAALKARELFKRDKDYIVERGEIIIVDEFTGRLMQGRRYSDGLHQAIEAKEGVRTRRENQTLASVTFQNYFRLYKKLSGMTGTATTESREFGETYKLDVLVVPTNAPMVRDDQDDVIYRTVEEKVDAIEQTIAELHASGQPVLVGTIAIDKSELLANRLKRRGVPCNVLNAKHHAKEAEIVAQAGRYGAVTIATNMAGRGTDIILGGNPEFLARKVSEPGAADWQATLERFEQQCEAEKKKVLAAGGLYILGTERHDSRRIDLQLRGRAGRQGDPGASKFFLSMEDDLMRLFGGTRVRNLMDRLGWEKGEPLEHGMISNAIERAQKKVENHHFEIRKQVLKYDDVMNEQRNIIYGQRQKALTNDSLREDILQMLDDHAGDLIDAYLPPGLGEDAWDCEGLVERLKLQFGYEIHAQNLARMERDEVVEVIKTKLRELYEKNEKLIGPERTRWIEKVLLLQMVDEHWKHHLYLMDDIQEGIGLQGYAGKNPLVEYKIQARDRFNDMIGTIKEMVLTHLFHIAVEEAEEVRYERKPEELVYGAPDGPAKPKKATSNKVGRNDPCSCGSGKKFKKCCGRKK